MKKNKNITNIDINHYLIAAFKNLGKSQKEIIKDLDKPQSYVSALMNGKKSVGKEVAKQLSELYGFDEGLILTGGLDSGNEESVYKPDGKIIHKGKLPKQTVYVIPVSGRGDLYNSFYSDEFMENELETEEMEVRQPHSKYSKYFKIEVEGVSMDDGTRRGLCEGDWVYCRSLEKIHWRSKLHTHKWKKWVFFHADRGIIIKSIKEQSETGELLLESFNPDKKRFPDFTIKLSECSFICNIVRVEYDESDF